MPANHPAFRSIAILWAPLLALACPALPAAAQPVTLPPSPVGVQTFTAEGIQFSHIHASNVTPFVPTNGPLARPLGGGSWDFGLARTEVTQGQYVEFIHAFNAVPVPEGRPWSGSMDSLFRGGGWVGPGVIATGVGPLGRLIYDVTEPGAVRPVSGMGFYGAALYVNWLQNNREASIDAITNGVYDLRQWSGGDATTWLSVTREPDAKYWLPSYDEWAVAGFYDQSRYGADQPGWWTHLSSRDRNPIPGPPGVGETAAGWEPPGNPFDTYLLPIASYPESQSPWGLLDMSGTFPELLEDHWFSGFDRVFAGTQSGPFTFPDLDVLLEQPGWVGATSPGSGGLFSFRIAASVVPGPATLSILLIANGLTTAGVRVRVRVPDQAQLRRHQRRHAGRRTAGPAPKLLH